MSRLIEAIIHWFETVLIGFACSIALLALLALLLGAHGR